MNPDCRVRSPLSEVSCKTRSGNRGVLMQRTTDYGQRTTDGLSTYNFSLRSLSALLITDTELNVIAAAASIGLSSSPKTG